MERIVITKLRPKPPTKPRSAFNEITNSIYYEVKSVSDKEVSGGAFIDWLFKTMILFTIVHLIYKYVV